jgi:hypothetical protein
MGKGGAELPVLVYPLGWGDVPGNKLAWQVVRINGVDQL